MAQLLSMCKRKDSKVESNDAQEEHDVDMEIAQRLWKNNRLLPPMGEHTRFRNMFSKFLMLCTVYTGIFQPLYAGFQITYHPVQLVIDYVIDSLFWVEIALIMRTAFFDLNNELIVDVKVIQMNYLRRRLGFDLVANFPWEVFALAAGYSYTSSTFGAWRLFRVLRFFRLRKVVRPILVDLNSSFGRRVVNMYPLIIHWVACIWWFIGSSGLSDGHVGKKDHAGGSSWLTRSSAMSAHNYNPKTLQPATGLQAYLSALYWATATLIKTAWIAPSTGTEKVYACVVVSLGAIMFAIFLGQFFKILQSFDDNSAQRREKMTTFRAFCAHNKLSKTMSRNIMTYAMAEWNTTQGVSTSETLKNLSGALSGQLLYEMRKDILQACSLLSATSLAAAKKLLLASTVQVCIKNELVVGYSQLVKELLILNKGSLQISVPNTRKGKAGGGAGGKMGGSKKNLMAMRMLEKQGAICGLWNPYERSARYPYEVQAKEFTTMLNISRPALLGVINQFDNDRAKILYTLEKEHDLVQSALKLGGARSSARLSVGGLGRNSQNEDEAAEDIDQDEIDAMAKNKENIFKMLGNLDGTSTSIRLVHMSIAEARRNAATMRDVMKHLGYTDDRGPGMRGSFMANSHSQQMVRDKQRDQIKDAKKSNLDEKREIVANRKTATDAATAAAIVL